MNNEKDDPIIILDGVRQEDKEIPSSKVTGHLTKLDTDAEEIMSSPLEMAEVLKVMNSDKRDANTRMTEVDFKARLSSSVFGAYLAYDTLGVLKFLPIDALFLTQQGKRLSVSVEGQGRKEAVDVVRGIIENREGKSFGERLGSMFQKKGEGNP